MTIKIALALLFTLPGLSFAGYRSVSCISIDGQMAVKVGINTTDRSKVVEIFRRNDLGQAEQKGFGGWTRENEIVRFESALKLAEGFNVEVERGNTKGVIDLSYKGLLNITLNDQVWNYSGVAECSETAE